MTPFPGVDQKRIKSKKIFGIQFLSIQMKSNLHQNTSQTFLSVLLNGHTNSSSLLNLPTKNNQVIDLNCPVYCIKPKANGEELCNKSF
jgi:hypothetical protein